MKSRILSCFFESNYVITQSIWMLSIICFVLWITEEEENILWKIQACQSITSRKLLSLESGLILDWAWKTTLSLEVLLCHPWNLHSIRLNTSNKRKKKQFVDIHYRCIPIRMGKNAQARRIHYERTENLTKKLIKL